MNEMTSSPTIHTKSKPKTRQIFHIRQYILVIYRDGNENENRISSKARKRDYPPLQHLNLSLIETERTKKRITSQYSPAASHASERQRELANL